MRKSPANQRFADERRSAPSARSLLVGDRRSRIASRAGGSGGASAPRTPRRGVWLVVLSLVLVSGCRLQLDVNVDVHEDGSGVVEVVVGLDPDAVRRIGGDLATVMKVSDLQDAGWVVDGPTKDSDGYTRVRIRHPFGTPAEAAQVFEEIAGKKGPFQHFRVQRDTSLASTTWRFSGTVDFSGGLEAFGDDGLAAQLDGEPLGQSVEDIQKQLGESLSRIIQVRVRARLPGHVTSDATTKADNGAVWQVGFGEGRVDMKATGHERRWSSLALMGIGGLAALALVVLLLVRLAGRVTRRDGGEPAPSS